MRSPSRIAIIPNDPRPARRGLPARIQRDDRLQDEVIVQAIGWQAIPATSKDIDVQTLHPRASAINAPLSDLHYRVIRKQRAGLAPQPLIEVVAMGSKKTFDILHVFQRGQSCFKGRHAGPDISIRDAATGCEQAADERRRNDPEHRVPSDEQPSKQGSLLFQVAPWATIFDRPFHPDPEPLKELKFELLP